VDSPQTAFRDPHGTTIDAQGLVNPATPGRPTIDSVDITPIVNATKQPFRFPSQTATDPNTLRIPQDLGPFITRGTITQTILDNPNSLLSDLVLKQNIVSTTTLFIWLRRRRRWVFSAGAQPISPF